MLYLYEIFLNIKNLDGDWGLGIGPNPHYLNYLIIE